MKRVVITGPTGMLGAELLKSLARDRTLELYGLGRTLTPALPRSAQFVIDLSKPIPEFDPESRPDVIVHTAALTDLGLCEREPALAKTVHVDASAALARWLKRGGTFIYISTDSVFDGERGSYTENDVPNPLNVYAQSKLMGERAVEEHAENSIVLRTNIYGLHEPLGKSLAEWAYAEWQAGRQINGFSDIFFNAVFTGQLAGIIRFLINESPTIRLLNVGSTEMISKYEFLNRLASALKVSGSRVVARKSSEFPTAIRRPRNTSLSTDLLSEFHSVPTFEMGIQHWIKSLG